MQESNIKLHSTRNTVERDLFALQIEFWKKKERKIWLVKNSFNNNYKTTTQQQQQNTLTTAYTL